ncbi:hypothetical protein Tco_0122572 [Tanacetum coccineum]
MFPYRNGSRELYILCGAQVKLAPRSDLATGITRCGGAMGVSVIIIISIVWIQYYVKKFSVGRNVCLAIEPDKDELESGSFHFGSLLAVIQSRNDEVNNVSTNLTYDVASRNFLMTMEARVCGVAFILVLYVKWSVKTLAASCNVRLASESEEFNQQEFRVRLDHYNFS